MIHISIIYCSHVGCYCGIYWFFCLLSSTTPGPCGRLAVLFTGWVSWLGHVFYIPLNLPAFLAQRIVYTSLSVFRHSFHDLHLLSLPFMIPTLSIFPPSLFHNNPPTFPSLIPIFSIFPPSWYVVESSWPTSGGEQRIPFDPERHDFMVVPVADGLLICSNCFWDCSARKVGLVNKSS